jgi:hypothetical protein
MEVLRGIFKGSTPSKLKSSSNKQKEAIPYYGDQVNSIFRTTPVLQKSKSSSAITGGGDIASTGSTIFNVGGTIIDATNKAATLVGFAVGLQTDQSVAGSCVYSSIALLVVYDSYTSNLQRVIKGLIITEWYSALVYNLSHVISNTLGFYEYCNIGYILDTIAFFVGLSITNMIEMIVRSGMASV